MSLLKKLSFMGSRASAVLLAAYLLLIPACTGPAGAKEPQSGPAPPEGSEDRGPVTRTVQGFRIQILTTPDKQEADAQVGQVLDWWRTVPSSERPPYHKGDDLPVEVAWRQPYYRVRLGAFASRAEAQRALDVFKDRFAEAFIVPDTVTITR